MDVSVVYFPSAVAIGALHALEPGHAKTLTAAYLIGTKGTKRDATLLGLSVAATHSIVVIGLSIIAAVLGREAFTGEASYYLAVGSSIAVIALGVWLLARRLKAFRRAKDSQHHHSHAPAPVTIKGAWFDGTVEIIDTPEGERFCLKSSGHFGMGSARIVIDRETRKEVHELLNDPSKPGYFFSKEAPAEPHEFKATLHVASGAKSDDVCFEIHEPQHHHDHALLSDDAHARAHAADLPAYVGNGERPSAGQILAFGAAGGLVPCPAAVSVMLLSLSVSQSDKGLILVLGFSVGLAIALVGIGLLIVTGMTKLASAGKFSRLSTFAPSIAAAMVIVSGSVGLLSALWPQF